MGKKKKSKKRGSREHGRGRKKGRGAGIRGGRGNAGANKHRRTKLYKEHGTDYFGDYGFNRPQSMVEEDTTTNVGDLARLAKNLEEDGHADPEADPIVVDLDAAGYDKLLGGGRVHHAFHVHVSDATDKARSKLEAEGGNVELTDDGDNPADEGNEPSNP